MSFSMPSLIGLIMLMGIATNNSILLVEYAIVARRGHDGSDGHPVVAPMSRHDALIDACRKRTRPVIMTTLAMGVGTLPMAATGARRGGAGLSIKLAASAYRISAGSYCF
ncbi:MAG TPA: efflux RND transporter permease subunit, partial [Rhodoferax sp.]|nr:efflux RND transporter permease subunit [Rhodoferax sp.]